MTLTIDLSLAYKPSEDIVVREIEGELILVPLTVGVGDMEDELYTLNETGRAVWERLDGRRSLKTVAADLTAAFEAPLDEIEADVRGLVQELVDRGILVPAGPGA